MKKIITFGLVLGLITLSLGASACKADTLTANTFTTAGAVSSAQSTAYDSWAEKYIKGYEEQQLAVPSFMNNYRDDIKRQELAMLLVKAYEKYTNSEIPLDKNYKYQFTDKCDAEYKDYIQKAYQLGIVSGYDTKTFGAFDRVTREQLATMLMRFIKKLIPNDNYDVKEEVKFADSDKIADWAKPAVLYAYKHNIIAGVGGNRIAPKDYATKEQAMAIIYRFLEQQGVFDAMLVDENDTYGITSGNAMNGNRAVKQGDWIYYTNPSQGEKSAIWKVKSDWETGKTKVVDVSANCLTVVNDWIYFMRSEPNERNPKAPNHNHICRVRTDGTGLTKLSDDDVSGMQVYGRWIYYVNNDDGRKMYRLSLDGKQKNKVIDDKVDLFYVCNGWIFYVNRSDNYSLYKIKTDGTEKTKLNNVGTGIFNIEGDWIYFTRIDPGALMKMKLDGTNQTVMIDRWYVPFDINISNGWIYFIYPDPTSYDNNHLCKMRLDGSDMKEIAYGAIGDMNIIDNWIYYHKAKFNGMVRIEDMGFYRMDTNGQNDTFIIKR